MTSNTFNQLQVFLRTWHWYLQDVERNAERLNDYWMKLKSVGVTSLITILTNPTATRIQTISWLLIHYRTRTDASQQLLILIWPLTSQALWTLLNRIQNFLVMQRISWFRRKDSVLMIGNNLMTGYALRSMNLRRLLVATRTWLISLTAARILLKVTTKWLTLSTLC